MSVKNNKNDGCPFVADITKVVGDYVPRHARLKTGNVAFQESKPAVHEIPDIVPVLSDRGTVEFEHVVRREVLASDYMKQFKPSDFKLENLLANGVVLKEVSSGYVPSIDIELLEERAKDLGIMAETYQGMSFVAPSVDSNSVEPLNPTENE